MKNWKLSPKEPWRFVAGKIYLSIYLSINKWLIFQLKPSLSTRAPGKWHNHGKTSVASSPWWTIPKITIFMAGNLNHQKYGCLWPCKIPTVVVERTIWVFTAKFRSNSSGYWLVMIKINSCIDFRVSLSWTTVSSAGKRPGFVITKILLSASWYHCITPLVFSQNGNVSYVLWQVE